MTFSDKFHSIISNPKPNKAKSDVLNQNLMF